MRGLGLRWANRETNDGGSGLARGAAALLGLLFTALLGACSGLDAPTLQSVPPRPEAELEIGERMVGAYVFGGVWQGLDSVHAVEEAIGHQFAINHWFTNWDNPWEEELAAMVLGRGSLPLITWQNHDRSFADIVAGRYDAYLKSWADGVAALGTDVYLRLFPEMNGDWVSWNGDPEGLKAAWRHIVGIFRAAGADNARFVWSPNVTDQPRTPENRMENYYPGHDVVDVLALDGYNWGTVRPWSSWRSFEDIFHEPYTRLSRIGPQPIWFAELASAEAGGDKGAWIEAMLSSRAFPRLEAIVWFSELKEADWRIESSNGALFAFRDWFADAPQVKRH